MAVILSLVVIVIILATRTERRPHRQSENAKEATVGPEGGEDMDTV